MKTLAVVPNFSRKKEDLEMLDKSLTSLRDTADCDIVVVDDASPYGGAEFIADIVGADFLPQRENRGFSHTVNVGLMKAHEEQRDAVLVNSDVIFKKPWLHAMENTDAAIVGALLLYPNTCIQHAGIYHSNFLQVWVERLKFGPHDLPAAHVPKDCPVTGALQFIRLETMNKIGVYDEAFKLGWEDVDYCLRAWKFGMRVTYQPEAAATHHESFTRGQLDKKLADWTNTSWEYLQEKWKGVDFSVFTP